MAFILVYLTDNSYGLNIYEFQYMNNVFHIHVYSD